MPRGSRSTCRATDNGVRWSALTALHCAGSALVGAVCAYAFTKVSWMINQNVDSSMRLQSEYEMQSFKFYVRFSHSLFFFFFTQQRVCVCERTFKNALTLASVGHKFMRTACGMRLSFLFLFHFHFHFYYYLS